MPKVRVHNLAMSLDGFAAGQNQSLAHPLGEGGERLHKWFFATRAARRMFGTEGGEEGTDHEWSERGTAGIGATIMGRNMFGPIRGDWGEEQWRGWWGEDPPFHHPVFVLTHYPREPLVMSGGTTFHFVTGGMQEALGRAFEAAAGLDVRIGGGPSTIQQFLNAGLIDEMHVVLVPTLLGSGERLFANVTPDLSSDYECAEFVSSRAVAHVLVKRRR